MAANVMYYAMGDPGHSYIGSPIGLPDLASFITQETITDSVHRAIEYLLTDISDIVINWKFFRGPGCWSEFEHVPSRSLATSSF